MYRIVFLLHVPGYCLLDQNKISTLPTRFRLNLGRVSVKSRRYDIKQTELYAVASSFFNFENFRRSNLVHNAPASVGFENPGNQHPPTVLW